MTVEQNYYDEIALMQLEPWESKGINFNDVIRASQHPEKLIRYKIINGNVYRSRECRFPLRCSGIEHFLLAISHSLPDIDFVININDLPVSTHKNPIPVLSFSKIPTEHNDILYPAWSFGEGGPNLDVIATWRWDLMRHELLITGDELDWDKRKQQIYFRGSLTNAQRVPFFIHAISNPERWNAKITLNGNPKKTQYARDVMNIEPIIGYVPPCEHVHYQYQLNFDGVAASFRLKFLLAIGSTVLYVNPSWMEFYYYKLKSHHHYYPVNNDIDLARSQIDTILSNPAESKQIAKNGRDFVEEHLTIDHVVKYWKVLLHRYAELQNFSPKHSPELKSISYSNSKKTR